MSSPDEGAAALKTFKAELRKVYEPPIRALLHWIDRQLRRSPRFYAWLSR